MSSKLFDVYIDSIITVRIPSGTDPDTREGYKILKELATITFIEILSSDKVDFTYKYLDEEEKNEH